MLAWLSVWSEVQTCIWPNWCQCHSLCLTSEKSRLIFIILVLAHPGSPKKGPLNVCVCVSVKYKIFTTKLFSLWKHIAAKVTINMEHVCMSIQTAVSFPNVIFLIINTPSPNWWTGNPFPDMFLFLEIRESAMQYPEIAGGQNSNGKLKWGRQQAMWCRKQVTTASLLITYALTTSVQSVKLTVYKTILLCNKLRERKFTNWHL